MVLKLQFMARQSRLRQRRRECFALARRPCTGHSPDALTRTNSSRKGNLVVGNGLNILFTPVPVPREDRQEKRLSGCAASIALNGNHRWTHLYIDWRERGGHELCSKLPQHRPGNSLHLGDRLLTSPRYWDFRDRYGQQAGSAGLPVRGCSRLSPATRQATDCKRRFEKSTAGVPRDIDELLRALALNPRTRARMG